MVPARTNTQAIVTSGGTPSITDEMLDMAGNLRCLCHCDGLLGDLLPPSFWSRKIRLATCHDALVSSVAETTFSLIIAGLKAFFPCRNVTRRGGWEYSRFCGHFPLRELNGTQVGIIGTTKIGCELIRILHSFNVDVAVTDPALSLTDTDRLRVTKLPLDELVSTCQVISVHAPPLPENRRMLSASHFQAMKSGAIFINTSHGSLVDEEALTAELRSGRIFAFIDTTDPEPPAPNHPFRTLSHVVLLPRIASATTNGCYRLGRLTIDQLTAFAGNTIVKGEVSREQVRMLV